MEVWTPGVFVVFLLCDFEYLKLQNGPDDLLLHFFLNISHEIIREDHHLLDMNKAVANPVTRLHVLLL